MIPVYQVELDDCFRACVASIFEKPLIVVPHFYRQDHDEASSLAEIRAWCASMGAVPLSVPVGGLTLPLVLRFLGAMNPGVHHILSGPNHFGVRHSVVCCNGRVVHDPAIPPRFAKRITADNLLGLRHGHTLCATIRPGDAWAVDFFADAALAFGRAHKSVVSVNAGRPAVLPLTG